MELSDELGETHGFHVGVVTVCFGVHWCLHDGVSRLVVMVMVMVLAKTVVVICEGVVLQKAK